MKALLNELLRVWINWNLRLYFSKIEVSGKEHIPSDISLIIVSNHQNALLDPLLIATMTGLKPYFLARADLFKKKFIAKLLGILQLIPVFRMRDGLSSIPRNQQSFSRCERLLAEKQAILIFPEGNHSLRRNVRPLSKGFTRIAFGAMKKYPSLPLAILPIGISYESHQEVRSEVRIEIGQPIEVAHFQNDARRLTEAAYRALKELTVNIPEDGYAEALKALKANHIQLTSPKSVADFLSGTFLNPLTKRKTTHLKHLVRVTMLLHWPLWLVWRGFRKKIKDPAFYGTFKFLIGLVGCPVYYVSIIVLSWLVGYTAYGLFFVLASFLGLAMFTKT